MLHRQTQLRDTLRIRLVVSLGAVLLCAPLLITACTSTSVSTSSSPLERLAQRQVNRPSARTINAEPPSGLRLPAIDITTDPNAYESLDAAISHFSSEQLPQPWREPIGAMDDDDITAEMKTEALRRYIAGHSELVGGNITEAIKHLDAASSIDPSESEIWRSLADAHWLAGDRLAATASYLRAIQRDPDDTVSLMRVGLSEIDRRSHQTAVILLSRAHRSISNGAAEDAAIPYIVGVALGRTLHELGWMNAGNEAIIGALDDLRLFSQPTSFRRELGATIRSASDAWRDTGDASIRLGRPDEAIDAYQRASELPSFDPAALLTRQIYASMRLGQPASAALLLANQVAHQRGLVDDRTLQLIQYLTQSSDIGSAFAKTIEQIALSLSSDERRLAASQLARAQAAALPDDRAIPVLIDRLIVAPSDESAFSDLLNRKSPDDAAGLVEIVSQLIQSNTIETERYADALLRYTTNTENLLDAMRAQETHPVGVRLLDAELSYDLGNIDRTRMMLEEARAISPDDLGIQLAQAQFAIKIVLTDEARALLDAIDIQENPEVMLAVAKTYRRLGDHQRAMTILEDRIWGGEATAEEALIAGETSLALGIPLDAEQFFKLAIELDPSLEEAHAGIITLYQNNGPLANQASLSDALRALREAIPSSQTLRWLRIQDLLRLDRLDQAQRELLSLAEESLDPLVIEQLISVWLRTGASETAQSWIADQLDQRPNNPGLVRLKARVQASQKDINGAINTLETWLARYPTDIAASRELENILRLESVDRHDDADSIAIKRLNRSAPSIRRSLELAPILIRQNRTREAIATLDAPLTGDLRFSRPGLENYGKLIAGAASIAVKNIKDDPASATEGLALLQRFLESYPDAPPSLHRALVALLIQSHSDPKEIAQVVVNAGIAYPQVSDDFTLDAFQQLIRVQEDDAAFQVVTTAARAMDSPTPRLLSIWMILLNSREDPEIALEILELVEQQKKGVETLAALNQLDSRIGIKLQSEEALANAELSYVAAIYCSGSNETAREQFYELALKHNPRHAMANNNLAYNWVEKDINLDQAHEMLTIANEVNPSSDAITDSLGWVRYKLGMIDDQRDEQGNIVLQGAVSLLTAAAGLSQSNSPGVTEILDHLADAQWRMGQTDRAIETWRQARIILRKIENIEPRNPLQQGLLDTVLPKVESKLDAVADGKIPPLAPMLRPRRWTQERIDNDKKKDLQGAPL